jgi:hypothetical protein
MKTITVAAPLCSPARHWLTQVKEQLTEYGAAQAGLHVNVREVAKHYMHIEVTVSDEYAAWCEYLLLRLGYQRLGALLHPKNQMWAQKYLDLAAGACWQQPGCKNQIQGAVAGELVVSAPPPSWRAQRAASVGRLVPARPEPAAREPGWLTWLRELL